MFAARRLSDLQKNPELLSASPDGPNSGYLVIQDEGSKKEQTCCPCLFWAGRKLPFPQDKLVFVHNDPAVFFIPVLNRPLSDNCYHAIISRGKHQGKALTSSREEDKYTTRCCWFFRRQHIVDVSPTPLDPKNLYQQFKIKFSSENGTFQATSKARDGISPFPLRMSFFHWLICKKNNLKLDTTAQGGLDPTLRARLPEFKIPLSQKPFVVGKWYSPFTFVKEGPARQQVARSMYYEVTLEQRWEKVFAWKNETTEGNGARRRVVMNNVVLESVEVFVGGRKALWNEKSESGMVWFSSDGKKKTSVGLREEVVKRMKWEQERGGWVKDKVEVDFVDECPGEGGDWSEFGRFVLVESFFFRRLDGSLVMSFDFKHFDKMRTSRQ